MPRSTKKKTSRQSSLFAYVFLLGVIALVVLMSLKGTIKSRVSAFFRTINLSANQTGTLLCQGARLDWQLSLKQNQVSASCDKTYARVRIDLSNPLIDRKAILILKAGQDGEFTCPGTLNVTQFNQGKQLLITCNPAPVVTVAPSSTPIPTVIAPTNTPIPQNTRFDGKIMIQARTFDSKSAEFLGKGPFYVYAWLPDEKIASTFNAELTYLQNVKNLNSPEVQEYALMFTSNTKLREYLTTAKATEVKAMGVTKVIYNSEAELSDDYDKLDDTDLNTNSLMNFVRYANQLGLKSGWAPVRNKLDSTYGLPRSIVKAAIAEGLDEVGLQEQKMVNLMCVTNLINGPYHPSAQNPGVTRDSSCKVIADLKAYAGSQPLDITVQIIPGYQHTEGCQPGDTYARGNNSQNQPNCPAEKPNVVQLYDHCKIFASELENNHLVNSIAIWASNDSEIAQVIPLIDSLRR